MVYYERSFFKKVGEALFSRTELFDRVYLTAVQSDKFKTGCFSINFLRPLSRQAAAQNALIPGLLLAGCEQYPDIRSISIQLDRLYGASVGTLVRKKGEIQSVGLYADFVEDALAGEPVFRPLTEFVSELLLRPCTENGGFRSDYFEMERNNLVNSMRATLNSKQAYANQEMLKAMCPDEPYGIPYQGEEETLADVDAKSLYAQYRTLLAHSRVELFYHGRASADEAADAFRAMLKELPRGSIDPLPAPACKQVARVRELEQSMPLSQSKLAMGFRARPASAVDELAAMLCFSVVYGAGSNCKLFLNVREAKSLCYYASAAYDKYKGFLRVSSGIAAENYAAARGEILRQLQDCVDGKISTEELENAKRLLNSQLRADLDNPGRLDEFYLGQAILDQRYTIPELMAAVERVDEAAVRQAAATVQLDTVYFLRGVGE